MTVALTDRVEQADIDELVENLREVDRRELWLLAMADPREAITSSVQRSGDTVAAVRDEAGALVCLFGVTSLAILGAHGAPWLLATDKMDENARDLLEHSKRGVAAMLERYETLSNIVWVGNVRSVRYLKALGFTFGPKAKSLLTGVEYLPFTLTREDLRHV